MAGIIRNSFPDLGWLKSRIASWAAQPGWPNVILHVQAAGCYRPDIEGPLSLFMNLKGQSHCAVEGKNHLIPENCYLITNPRQPYTLAIDGKQPVETFNIHFGDRFLEQVYAGLALPEGRLLDNPLDPAAPSLPFFNKLYFQDEAFKQIIRQLYACSVRQMTDAVWIEDLLTRLAVYLLRVHQQISRQVTALPPVKRATQVEAYKRLCLAVDYMHSCYQQPLTLEELAGVACLSKFHFLRLFQACFRQSPYQYLTGVRLEKAKVLLRETQLPVSAIAQLVSFPNLSSFCRLFQKKEQAAAAAYRLQYRAK
jgi:AraC family transcriptional regulator